MSSPPLSTQTLERGEEKGLESPQSCWAVGHRVDGPLSQQRRCETSALGRKAWRTREDGESQLAARREMQKLGVLVSGFPPKAAPEEGPGAGGLLGRCCQEAEVRG